MTSVTHTSSDPIVAIDQPPVWAWPLASLLGFPIGGYAANLIVGPVDAPGPAIAGGLIAGAVIGAAQWFAIRRFVPWIWIAATSVGMGIGLAVGAAVVDYGIGRGELMLMGAVTGAALGALQALLMKRAGLAFSGWWAVLNPPTWALAWLITTYVISRNVEEQFTNFGASGTLLYALGTALLLRRMLAGREPRVELP